jgi:nucleotide-binding universal stress UspA family protein
VVFEQVLLCDDGSEAARRALRLGAELAILLGARVHLLSIVPTGFADPVLSASVVGQPCIAVSDPRKGLDESIEWLRAQGVTADGYLANGDVIDQILAHAKRLAIDLIVLGHYPQRSGGSWWRTGSYRSLAARANCCVLIAVNPAKTRGEF